MFLHAAPQLLNGILHALNRSAHQRLADSFSGVAMAAAAERIWMFLGWDFVAGCVGAEQDCSPLTDIQCHHGNEHGWCCRWHVGVLLCNGTVCPSLGCWDADLCVQTAHPSSLQPWRGGSPSHAALHVEVGQLNYTLRNAGFSPLALKSAETESSPSSIDSVGA